MGRIRAVTQELIELVNEKHYRYPEVTQTDLGRMCGISQSTVKKILDGEYEEKFSNQQVQQNNEANSSTSGHDYSADVIDEIEEIICEQKRTNDLLQVIGVILAHGLLPEENDRNEKCRILHNLNPDLKMGELSRKRIDPFNINTTDSVPVEFARTLTREQVLNSPAVTHWYEAYKQYCIDKGIHYTVSQRVVTRAINNRFDFRTEKNARDRVTGREIRTFVPNEKR